MTIVIKDLSNQKAGKFKIGNVNFDFRRVNFQRSEPLGNPESLIMHHTATPPNVLYDDYHFNISEIDKQVFVFKTLKWIEKGMHLWTRNSNNISNTFCCKATGKDVPSPKMIDVMAILQAEQCAWKNIDIFGKVTVPKKQYVVRKQEGKKVELLILAPGTIIVNRLSDHGEYAKLDGYSHLRWDVGENIRKQVIILAQKYYKELKAGKRQFIFKDLLV